jgi:hypothetical protein
LRAQSFALTLLMPAETVKKVWLQMRTQEKPALFDVIAIARYFGADYASTLQRFQALDIISEREKKSLETELTRSGNDVDTLLGYTFSEVRLSGEELFPDRYVKLALDSFRMEKIPAGRLAKYLGMSIYETNRLIEKLRIENAGVVRKGSRR